MMTIITTESSIVAKIRVQEVTYEFHLYNYSKKISKVAGFDKNTVVRRTNLALINEIKTDLNKDIDLNQICFIDNMAVQAKWIDLKELYNMIENGEISWVLISRIEEYVIPLMKETDNQSFLLLFFSIYSIEFLND